MMWKYKRRRVDDERRITTTTLLDYRAANASEMVFCRAESVGRPVGARAKNPATHTYTRERSARARDDGSDGRDLMHSTKRAAARVVLVVTPSISAANFVHVQPAEEDVHDNDDNYTHTHPTTACTGLSKTIIILIYKYANIYITII